MNKKKSFIKTSDKETYQLLLKEGFTQIGKENDKWVFLNDKNLKFSEDNKENILYTDMLSI